MAFKQFEKVKHLKTGKEYRIEDVPCSSRLLEYCAETYYGYEDISGGEYWIRCKSEMEDGRFVKAED